MYIKEDITLDLLKNKGYDANSIPSFIQGILNTKYDFILKEEDTSKVNAINPREFALLMYMFNSLITVENMEFDNTCYYVSYGKSVDTVYHIPQPNGYDAILKYNFMSPVFIKSPSFMVNGIVHPETYDTKTVYLDLLYRLILSDFPINYDILLPFGEGIRNMFLEAKRQIITSDKVISKLILSQFPSFIEYMESISGYLKELFPASFEPTAIKNKKIDTEIIFKSIVFNSMKEGVKIDKNELSEKYDKSLSEKYNKYLNKALEEVEILLNNNLYAYPRLNDSLIYPYNEDLDREKVKSLYRVTFNAEIYFQVLNRVLPENSKEGMLEIAYKVKKAYYTLLKALYFSYHMCFNKYYGELYYNSLIKEIKDDFTFSKIKEDIYYPVWTLNQCNSIKNREILNSLILKTVWHNNKFIMRKVEAPVRKLLSEKNNDMYIFKNLNGLYKQFTPQDTGFDKGQFRYNELLKTGLFSIITKNKNARDIKYLDFGGGIGDVSSSIAKNVGFLKENSFVTDIQNWLGKEHTEEYAKNITYRYLKTNDLPFESNSIDFITCLQVLHHIPDKKYTLSQLYRILKPGGIILVREHNCENIQDQMLIDLEHSLHGFVVDEQGQDYLQNYNDTYMNKLELSSMMIASGFEEVTQNIVFPEDKGITKYYYSLWRVVKDEINKSLIPVKKSWADYSDDEEEDESLILEQSNSSVKKSDKCYVWLLMKGDDYTPGVYASVHSINRTKSCKDNNINTVVMVTNDVSENAIKELKKVCDYIVRVDYIKHPTKALRTERQRELYSSWIDVSYTKWQMLRLPFKKAIFLDSDIIIVDNIDNLFNLKAPAGVFSSPFAYPAGKLVNYYVNNSIVGDDGYAKNGSPITKSMIKNAMLNTRIEKRTTTVAATSILLEPNVEDFNNYINMLKTEFKNEFGFGINSGADEQSISYYYSLYDKGPKLDWTNIHHRYNFLSWKTERFLNDEMPYIIHFLSQPKPWKLNISEYKDLVNWYIMFLDGLKEDTSFFKNVIDNISLTEKDINKLKEICLNMDQSYIRSLSSNFKKVKSCLDVLCNIQKK